MIQTILHDDGTITKQYQSGDFVVCNLSSVNLGNVAKNEALLERLIPIQVRMLDNVIDLNNIEVPQAQHTNKQYRAIGLGMFGLHHYFALKGLHWGSEESIEETDRITEKIAYLTIEASTKLAKEKGKAPHSEGSDWENGEHLKMRGYFDSSTKLPVEKWKSLQEEITKHGVRNLFMISPAPNASTSIIIGSTASLDPIFDIFYHEEKKSYKLPVLAPDLSYKTYEYYNQPAYQIDQFGSVKIREKIQRNIDQASSFNLFVPNTIKASVLLNLHMDIWKRGIKTTYYVRSTTTKVESCEWCEA